MNEIKLNYKPDPETKQIDDSRWTREDFAKAVIRAGGQIHFARLEEQFFPPDSWPEEEWSRLWSHFGHDASTYYHGVIDRLIAETVSLAYAADQLGCSSSDVQKLVKDGALGGIYVNRIWRVSKYHLADYQGQKLPPESAVP